MSLADPFIFRGLPENPFAAAMRHGRPRRLGTRRRVLGKRKAVSRVTPSRKRARSHTRTKTRNPRKKFLSHGYRSKSSFRRLKTLPLYMKVGKAMFGSKTIVTTGQRRLDCAANEQAFTSVRWLHGMDVNLSATDTSTAEGTSLEELGEYALFGGVGTSLMTSGDRMHLVWSKMVFQIANNTSVPVNLNIYDLVAISNLQRTHGQNNAFTAVKVAMEHEQFGPGDPALPLVFGTMPHKRSEFHRDYKIERKQVIQLIPGQVHRHGVFVRHNRTYSTRLYQRDAGVTVYGNVRGLTRHTLFQIWGTPVNSAATHTDVGNSVAAVDITYKFEARTFHANLSNDNKTKATNIYDVKTLVSPEAMDMLGDTTGANVN